MSAVMQLGMKKANNVLAAEPSLSPLPPATTTTSHSRDTDRMSSLSSAAAEAGKENMEAKAPQGWLSKWCSKLRSKQRRQEKCEKCGQRSETCVANASFISGRKHFLCQDCRTSSDNMKNMYRQLRRNLSLREARAATACNSAGGDLTPPLTSAATTSSPGGVVRSRSMRSRKAAPESGYETATSLDSSCSNGRLSPEPVSTSSGGGECGRCTAHPASAAANSDGPHRACDQADRVCSKDADVCSRDKSEVFGGAFKSERARLREIQPKRKQQKVYTRPKNPAAPHCHHQQGAEPQPNPASRPHPHHHHNHHQHEGAERYDGYLEIRTPNSSGVKYVFRPTEGRVAVNDEVQDDHLSRRRHTENLKQCYRCHRYRCIAFRAPFQSGWLCEDCMDDLL